MSDNDYTQEKISMEEALSAIAELVENAKAMPLSASVLVPRDEILYLVDAALDAIPVEIRQAQLILRERHEIAEKAKFEADEIIASATSRAERLVARTEIIRQANQNANRLMQTAKEESAKLKYEAQDFVDQKLASFEAVLDSVAKTVKAGREKLATVISEPFDPANPLGMHSDSPPNSEEGDSFYDQDLK